MGIEPGLSFPRAADRSSLPSFPSGPAPDLNDDVRNRTHSAAIVLLVEDNSADVYMIGRVLKQCGIPLEMRVATDGEQALALLNRWEQSTGEPQPSLILLDWNLPRVSGAEVLAYARRSERWQKIPVVVVTSSNSPRDVKEMKALGATGHFPKPTELDAYFDLKRIVLDVLPKPSRSSSSDR